ncbi:MAG: class SAM-dependent methyltransferase [Thermoleophilia bacterium]|nr:class SAM-dependent methyltransferase [Thermoleophilia bacterium]
MSLNDPDVVRQEYASERGLEARRSLYDHRVGPDSREVMWDKVVAVAPRRVLEVGPGPGEVSERMLRELGCEVVAIDVSERMVDLARSRGVDARVGDVQELPFADEEFDLVVAAWILFHVPDLDRGLAEIARVLAPGGRLVAVTNSEHHLAEARLHAGISMVGRVTFSRENGEEALRRHFARVERTDVDGSVTFADGEAIRSYFRSLVIWKHAADGVPELTEPLEATMRNSIFVAVKAA